MAFGERLKKVAGLFVEIPEEDTPASVLEEISRASASSASSAPVQRRTIEEVVRQQPGPNLDEIKVPTAAPAPAPAPTAAANPAPATPTEPVIGPDGKVNFNAIYQLAKLPQSPFTAEQVLELLASLPAELPISAKRTTLKVTLEAMSRTLNVSSEVVVADASRKLAALASYGDGYGEQAKLYVSKATAEIANLEAEIQRRKVGIAEAERRANEVLSACQAESDRLDDVLEFFSLDVPPSKYAAPAEKPGL